MLESVGHESVRRGWQGPVRAIVRQARARRRPRQMSQQAVSAQIGQLLFFSFSFSFVLERVSI